MMKLDHIMYSAGDLEKGVAEIEALTGVRADYGGSHPGKGTRNALLSLGVDQYLEIIAPDPAQNLSGTMGEELQQQNFTGIRMWAAATQGFDLVKKAIDIAGFGHHVVEMSRTRPDGVELKWQLLFVTEHPFGNHMPFFIDWLSSPHPSSDCPSGCALTRFSVELLENVNLFQTFIDALELDVEVLEGPDSMRAVVESPNGRVMLH